MHIFDNKRSFDLSNDASLIKELEIILLLVIGGDLKVKASGAASASSISDEWPRRIEISRMRSRTRRLTSHKFER